MPKAQIKSLLLSSDNFSTSSTYNNTLPTVSAALSNYKQSLDKVQQAKSRFKVLNRQLQKQKSTTSNLKRYNQHADYIQEKAQIDRLMKKWNETNKSIQLDKQSLRNKRSRMRIKDNIHHHKFSNYQSNLERYHHTKVQSEQNQQYISQFNKELIKQRVNNRKSLQRQQRYRQEHISYLNELKQERIRHQKSKEIKRMFNQSLSNHKIVNSIVEHNYSLKNKRYRQFETSKQLKTNQLPVNMACTIKNPEI